MRKLKNKLKKYIKPGILFVCLSPLSQATARPALRYTCRFNTANNTVRLGPPQKVTTTAPAPSASFTTEIEATTETTSTVTPPVTATTGDGRPLTTLGRVGTPSTATIIPGSACILPLSQQPGPANPTDPRCGPPELTTRVTNRINSTGFIAVGTHMVCRQGNIGTTDDPEGCLVSCTRLPGYQTPKSSANLAYSATLYNFLMTKVTTLKANPQKHRITQKRTHDKAHKKLHASKSSLYLNRKHHYLLAKIATSLVLKELNKANKEHQLKPGEKIELERLNPAQRQILASYQPLLKKALLKAQQAKRRKHKRRQLKTRRIK